MVLDNWLRRGMDIRLQHNCRVSPRAINAAIAALLCPSIHSVATNRIESHCLLGQL